MHIFDFEPRNKKAIMIGDSIHDIKAAKEAKISSCLIDHRKRSESQQFKYWKIRPDYIIEHFNDLINL